jgi:subtilisin family serine protease
MTSPRIVTALSRSLARAPAGQPLPVIIKLRPGGRIPWARLGDLPLRHTFTLLPALALTATAERINQLADDPNVELVWPDLPVHTWLDVSVPLLGVPKAWAAGYTGKGITIAVVDTGVDTGHPDLAGRVAGSKDFTGAGFADGHGHGTHVCSIAAGSGAASQGKYTGVAPEATLVVARVLKSDGSGMTSDVMAGVEWVVAQKARVINLSLGASGSCDGTDALSALCDVAWEQGVVVCVAAGNDGPSGHTVGAPGCARKVITVGASDDQDAVADFSSRGPTLDGREKPDLCLPGVGIMAARAGGTSMGHPLDQYYTAASGTSMATPHCAGAAALLLQARPDRTPDQIKGMLMQTAKGLGLDANTQGAGRADVANALGLGGVQPPSANPGCGPAAIQGLLGLKRK